MPYPGADGIEVRGEISPQSATSLRAVPRGDAPGAAVLPSSPHCSPSPSSLLCCTSGASPGLLRCLYCVHQRAEPPWSCSSSALETEGTRCPLLSCFGSAPFITLGTKPEALHTQPCSGAERDSQPALGTAVRGRGGGARRGQRAAAEVPSGKGLRTLSSSVGSVLWPPAAPTTRQLQLILNSG